MRQSFTRSVGSSPVWLTKLNATSDVRFTSAICRVDSDILQARQKRVIVYFVRMWNPYSAEQSSTPPFEQHWRAKFRVAQSWPRCRYLQTLMCPAVCRLFHFQSPFVLLHFLKNFCIYYFVCPTDWSFPSNSKPTFQNLVVILYQSQHHKAQHTTLCILPFYDPLLTSKFSVPVRSRYCSP